MRMIKYEDYVKHVRKRLWGYTRIGYVHYRVKYHFMKHMKPNEYYYYVHILFGCYMQDDIKINWDIEK